MMQLLSVVSKAERAKVPGLAYSSPCVVDDSVEVEDKSVTKQKLVQDAMELPIFKEHTYDGTEGGTSEDGTSLVYVSESPPAAIKSMLAGLKKIWFKFNVSQDFIHVRHAR